MTRPTKTNSSNYRIRMGVPKHLREIVKRRHGFTTELFENLGTKVDAEAKRLTPGIVAKFQDWLAAAQAEYDGRPERLTDREVAAVCGRWVAMKEAEAEHDAPTSFSNFETEIDYLRDVEAGLRPLSGHEDRYDGDPIKDALECTAEEMEPLLADLGRHVDQDTKERLARLMVPNMRRLMEGWAEQNTSGRQPRSIAVAEFPSLAPRAPASASKAATQGPAGCTFDALLTAWALDRGFQMDAKPIPRPLYDRLRTLERFADFLGHRDATKVTKADVLRWKVSMQTGDRPKHASTIRNDFSEMSAVWKTGIANDLLGKLENPFKDASPKKAVKKKQEKRAFTEAEAVAIVAASREKTGALRWLPLVLCLTGARLGEVMQSTKSDIFVVDGVHVFRIHDEGEGRSLKNADSRRTVPIHPALIREGFLDYVAALPSPQSSLWPDIRADGVFGTQAANGSRLVSRWLRKLGHTDPAISPSHSWRHWFISACRREVMPHEVRSALTGHSARLDESAGYGDNMGTFVQVLARFLATVRVPGEVGEVPPESPRP